MFIKCRTTIAIVLVLLVSAFSASADVVKRILPAEWEIFGSVQVTGRCAQYFQDGTQIRSPGRNLRCSARVTFPIVYAYPDTLQSKQLLPPPTNPSALKEFVLIGQPISIEGENPPYNPLNAVISRKSITDTNGVGKVIFRLKYSRPFLIHLYTTIDRRSFLSNGSSANCDSLNAAFSSASTQLRACERDSDCTQVLRGTSCGGTHEWVGNDNSSANFYQLLNALLEQGCQSEQPLISICDAREADGFRCVAGQCEWHYLS